MIFGSIIYQTSRLHVGECTVQDLRESIENWVRYNTLKTSEFECEKVAWERLNKKDNNYPNFSSICAYTRTEQFFFSWS